MSKKKTVKMPPIAEVAKFLTAIKKQLKSWGLKETDVRLQVWPDGQWNLHSGDAQYDQDHRGYWGASGVSTSDSADDLRRAAKDLIEQARDDVAMDVD
jgi:hypothetical protein